MRRKLGTSAVLLLILLLAAACSGVTHTTVADALAGSGGDAIELAEAQITSHISVVTRQFASDLLEFDVTDRSGQSIRVEVSQSNIEFQNGQFVRVAGTLRADGPRMTVTSTIVNRMSEAPADWPDF